MACKKCSYKEKNEKILFNIPLCNVCSKFAPINLEDFEIYVEEKLDWQTLDSFRKFGQSKKNKQKLGMQISADKGKLVTRPPLGYDVNEGILKQNEDASRVHSLFKTFLNRKYSLNSLAKNFSLSTNGLKKVLTNRTYLGEIKFDGKINKGNHQAIISPEIFYAVQRKMKEYLRPRKKII